LICKTRLGKNLKLTTNKPIKVTAKNQTARRQTLPSLIKTKKQSTMIRMPSRTKPIRKSLATRKLASRSLTARPARAASASTGRDPNAGAIRSLAQEGEPEERPGPHGEAPLTGRAVAGTSIGGEKGPDQAAGRRQGGSHLAYQDVDQDDGEEADRPHGDNRRGFRFKHL